MGAGAGTRVPRMHSPSNATQASEYKGCAIPGVRRLLISIALAIAAFAPVQNAVAAVPESAPRPTLTQPLPEPVAGRDVRETIRPTPADNDTARWLAGLPPVDAALRSFALVPAWKQHAKELDAAWAESERDRLTKVRAWAPAALGAVHAAESPVFYFFSGPDFLYPHALFPRARNYVLCAREPVGSQPDPTRIPPGELPGALANFRKSLSSLLDFSFFITKDLRKDVEQRHIPGILPMLELILAREGARVLEVQPVRCGSDGALSMDGKAKGGSPGVRIRFQTAALPEQTLYYFYGDISNGGLKTHGGVLRFCETLGRGRSLLKAASFLPHESEFTRINEWVLDHSSAIVQDPSGIPFRTFANGKWTLRFWGRSAQPIEIFAKYTEPALQSAVDHATAPRLPFGFGYQHEASKALLILAERTGAE